MGEAGVTKVDRDILMIPRDFSDRWL